VTGFRLGKGKKERTFKRGRKMNQWRCPRRQETKQHRRREPEILFFGKGEINARNERKRNWGKEGEKRASRLLA